MKLAYPADPDPADPADPDPADPADPTQRIRLARLLLLLLGFGPGVKDNALVTDLLLLFHLQVLLTLRIQHLHLRDLEHLDRDLYDQRRVRQDLHVDLHPIRELRRQIIGAYYKEFEASLVAMASGSRMSSAPLMVMAVMAAMAAMAMTAAVRAAPHTHSAFSHVTVKFQAQPCEAGPLIHAIIKAKRTMTWPIHSLTRTASAS